MYVTYNNTATLYISINNNKIILLSNYKDILII